MSHEAKDGTAQITKHLAAAEYLCLAPPTVHGCCVLVPFPPIPRNTLPSDVRTRVTRGEGVIVLRTILISYLSFILGSGLMKVCFRLAFSALFATSLFGANILLNFGFESPDISPSPYTMAGSGSNFITDWIVTGGTCGSNCVIVIDSAYTEGSLALLPHGGNQSLDITGGGNTFDGGVEQTVTLPPGTLYELSFWVGNQDNRYGKLRCSSRRLSQQTPSASRMQRRGTTTWLASTTRTSMSPPAPCPSLQPSRWSAQPPGPLLFDEHAGAPHSTHTKHAAGVDL